MIVENGSALHAYLLVVLEDDLEGNADITIDGKPIPQPRELRELLTALGVRQSFLDQYDWRPDYIVWTSTNAHQLPDDALPERTEE